MLTNKKPAIEKYLDPVAVIFKNVNPNTLTLLGSIPSILFFVFMVNHWYIAALIAFAGSALDMLDGLVARKFNKVTKFGGVFDSTFDRIADFLIISSFAFAGIVRWEIAAPVLLTSFLVSYVRTRSESASQSVSFAVGLIERGERLLIIIAGLIMYIFIPQSLFFGINVAEAIFIALFVLSLYTFCQRLIHAYKVL